MHWKLLLFYFLGIILGVGYPYSMFSHHNLFLGFLIAFYFVSQVVLATINYSRMSQAILTIENRASDTLPGVSLLIVGYRENPDYWKNCIESILQSEYPQIKSIIAMIDGDEEEDVYMKDIFEETCLEHCKLDCVARARLLPHRGKRFAMEAGFRHILESNKENEYIIVIDSDTILEKQSIQNLVACMESNLEMGCATGNIGIFNKNNWLARIIHARYAYAFTLERSAMAAVGVMNCCSGPFSIYRQAFIDSSFLEEFITQKFMGKLVGPGDDRHATLLLMARGHLSGQTPFAIATTETPDTFHRYFQQQLRWMRSFYREQFWQIRAIPTQHPYLMVITLYELFFPFFLFFSMPITFQLIPSHTVLWERFSVTLFVLCMRTVILLLFNNRRPEYLWNLCLFPIYMCGLFPIKMYALMTCGVQGWITSSRKTVFSQCHPDIAMIYISILLWNGYIGYMIYNYVMMH